MSETEREDLLALLTHPGWLRLVRYTKDHWGVKVYAKRLEQAKDMSELAALKMANDWLSEIIDWPSVRSETLTKNLPERNLEPSMSRRGGL